MPRPRPSTNSLNHRNLRLPSFARSLARRVQREFANAFFTHCFLTANRCGSPLRLRRVCSNGGCSSLPRRRLHRGGTVTVGGADCPYPDAASRQPTTEASRRRGCDLRELRSNSEGFQPTRGVYSASPRSSETARRRRLSVGAPHFDVRGRRHCALGHLYR
jgi:hypothetical protein